ncbi:MAG: condensation domain-containing protein [Sulfitobacter sp.]
MLQSVTLSSVLHIKPGLNPRRLARAFKAMCNRHDVTRGQFGKLGGSWKCSIADAMPAALNEHDFLSITEEDIEPTLITHARRSISMFDTSLVRLDVLHFGDLGNGLILRAHHGITDGFGMNVMLDDLLKQFVGMPVLGPALSHAQYMQDWGGDTKPAASEIEAYWEKKLLPPSKPLNIGRIKRGLPMLTNTHGWRRFRSLGFRMRRQDTERVEELSRVENVTPFMLVNAAFLLALAQAGNAEEVLYSVTLGRSDSRLSRYAGHHTLHPFMRCHMPEGRTLGSIARASTQEFAISLDHMPSPAGRRSGWWDKRLLAAGGYPRQITSGSLNPNARAAQPAPDAAEPSNGFRIGRYELRRITMPPEAGDMDELTFRPDFDTTGGQLDFKYDVDAFDDSEVVDIAECVFDQLGIAPDRGRMLDTATEAATLRS